MAARRIAKSTADWAKFAERVPPNQIEHFRAFKVKCDGYVNKVHQYPESLPKIDFASYKGMLPGSAMVDKFQKAYDAVSVPYPKDNANLLGKLDEGEKKSIVESEQIVANLEKEVADAKLYLSKVDSVPLPHEMTLEMKTMYFPGTLPDGNHPTEWPHTVEVQPENHPGAWPPFWFKSKWKGNQKFEEVKGH